MREKPVGFVDNEPTQVLQRETATCPQVLNQPSRCSHEDIHRAPPARHGGRGGAARGADRVAAVVVGAAARRPQQRLALAGERRALLSDGQADAKRRVVDQRFEDARHLRGKPACRQQHERA